MNETHACICLLTPCSRVPLEKLTGFQLVKIPHILWNPKVNYCIHKCLPPVPILCQLDQVHTPTSNFLKIHLNIILSSMPWSFKWSLSLRFPHQNHVYDSPLTHMCYMTRTSHSSRFYHPNNIGWVVQIISSSLTYAGVTAEKYFRISWDININKIVYGQFSTLININRKSEEMKIIPSTQFNMFEL